MILCLSLPPLELDLLEVLTIFVPRLHLLSPPLTVRLYLYCKNSRILCRAAWLSEIVSVVTAAWVFDFSFLVLVVKVTVSYIRDLVRCMTSHPLLFSYLLFSLSLSLLPFSFSYSHSRMEKILKSNIFAKENENENRHTERSTGSSQTTQKANERRRVAMTSYNIEGDEATSITNKHTSGIGECKWGKESGKDTMRSWWTRSSLPNSP